MGVVISLYYPEFYKIRHDEERNRTEGVERQ